MTSNSSYNGAPLFVVEIEYLGNSAR